MKRLLKILALTVAVVLATITVGVIVSRSAWIQSARQSAHASWTALRLRWIVEASSNYFRFYTNWPTSFQDFDSQSARNPRKTVFLELKEDTNDGWGHPLIYKAFDSSVGHGSVISYGRDGHLSGSGYDADIEIRFGARKNE